MSKVEFHFDFGSPNAYLAHLVIPEIEQRTGVKFEYVPVLLGGVYKPTGNRSPAESLTGSRTSPSTSDSRQRALSSATGSRASGRTHSSRSTR